MISSSTICALSTPQGAGAIAVIRVSGSEAFPIVAKLMKVGDKFCAAEANQAMLAGIYDGSQMIDQVVVTKFVAPHSYTGEDVVEISCHGSFYIRQKIMSLLLQNGCRTAQPGEFTMRAFLNGRMDLPQAEAVADLIESQSEMAHKLAVNQLKGNVSHKLADLRQQLVDLASLMELELDFSEEDVEFADRQRLKELLATVKTEVQGLANSFKLGNSLKNGIPVAIVGSPNVGKSTLLNALVDEERAIVSDIPGTTRDTIEETFNLDGLTFRFIDTAGIRESDNEIEKFGIERSFHAIEKAEVVLYVFDIENETLNQVLEVLQKGVQETDLSGKRMLLLANKCDKLAESVPQGVQKVGDYDLLYISAKMQEHLNELKQWLVQSVHVADISDNTLLTNARHYDSMLQIERSIESVEQGMAAGLSTDLLAVDVRAALDALGEVTGTVVTDELLNNIFGRFCIGK